MNQPVKSEEELAQIEAQLENDEPVVISLKHKIRMNRIIRKETNDLYIPFPEANTPFEKARSRFVSRVEHLIAQHGSKES